MCVCVCVCVSLSLSLSLYTRLILFKLITYALRFIQIQKHLLSANVYRSFLFHVISCACARSEIERGFNRPNYATCNCALTTSSLSLILEAFTNSGDNERCPCCQELTGRWWHRGRPQYRRSDHIMYSIQGNSNPVQIGDNPGNG